MTWSEQVQVGVDVVNDGEQGKPSYVSYVRSRLVGSVERHGRSALRTSLPTPTSQSACSRS